jgi:hypothetical protein
MASTVPESVDKHWRSSRFATSFAVTNSASPVQLGNPTEALVYLPAIYSLTREQQKQKQKHTDYAVIGLKPRELLVSCWVPDPAQQLLVKAAALFGEGEDGFWCQRVEGRGGHCVGEEGG